MLIAEAENFVREQIITRWPRWKRSGVEVSDFIRQLKKIDADTALEAIIRCKETSKTITYPVLAEFRSKIAEVIREENKNKPHTTTEISDKYIACYALDDAGKSIQFLSGSSSPEGAQTQFAAYLAEYGKNPTDYVFYIGFESFDRFFHDRYEIHCKQNPKIAESTERLRKIVDGGGKIIPAFENILPEFNKDFDDGVPF